MRLQIIAAAAAAVLGLVGPTRAAPVDEERLEMVKRDFSTASPVAVSAGDVGKWNSYIALTSAAYCNPDRVKALACGEACSSPSLSGVQILATGGDEHATPRWLVAYLPVTKEVVVTHSGTNPFSLLSIANDVNIIQTSLDSSFPGQKGGEKVHSGFLNAWSRSYGEILPAVQSALSSTGASSLTVAGHSLGAAIGTFDYLALRRDLGNASLPIQARLFGSPRVGNAAFASYIDAQSGSFQRVTNRRDPVPRVPLVTMDYQHPNGEIWISNQGRNWVSCPGIENQNCADSNGVLEIDIIDHLGPYSGIWVALTSCR